jgi:hypothetical protein
VAEAETRLRALLLKPDPALTGNTGPQDWREIPLPAAGPTWLALAALRALGRSAGDIAFATGQDPAPGHVLPWVPVRLDASAPSSPPRPAPPDPLPPPAAPPALPPTSLFANPA